MDYLFCDEILLQCSFLKEQWILSSFSSIIQPFSVRNDLNFIILVILSYFRVF